MWVLIAREPRPDAAYWPGRQMLAVLDAVTWPALWFYGAMQLPNKGGMIGGFVAACAVLAGLSRLHTAVWHNHRYGFTTWRWGKVLAWMVVFTYVLKWVMVC